MAPSEFNKAAEESELILPIGKWVLTEACKFLNSIQQTGKNIHISINISVKQLLASDFVENTLKIIENSGVKYESVYLEVTESILMTDMVLCVEKLNLLRHKGIGVSLDDFGTGYSSLTYLQTLPITTLKIDKAFVENLAADSKRARTSLVLETMVQMAHHLEYQVVAEGVETKEQLEIIKKIGCDYCQGFLLSRPLPTEEASELLNH